MRTIGISGGFGHDAAAALVVDGELEFALEEERLTRAKEAPWMVPIRSIQAALDHGSPDRGSIRDIDALVLSWDPDRILDDPRPLYLAHGLRSAVEATFGSCPPIEVVDHHRSHAMAAWATSGWSDCAIVVLDDRGEDRSGTIHHARHGELHECAVFPMRDSVGAMYNGVTRHIGFGGEQAGKTMGLASYGSTADVLPWFELGDDGCRFTGPVDGPQDRLPDWTTLLTRCFGPATPLADRRSRNSLPEPPAVQLAALAQNTLELIVGHLVQRAHALTGERRIALAGGVAMNCTNNGRLRAARRDLDLFVYGPAGDAGGAVGAAFAVQDRRTTAQAHSLGLGLEHTTESVAVLAEQLGAQVVRAEPHAVASAAAHLIAAGSIGGWYCGRDEFGPRALGNRSIVARADSTSIADRVNRIKGREAWRPLAPALTLEAAQRIGISDPEIGTDFMVEARWPERSESLAGATHVDGSMRPLVVRRTDHPFRPLLDATAALGIDTVLNTSFNCAGEPIVSSPRDALRTFAASELDFVALGSTLVVKPGCPGG